MNQGLPNHFLLSLSFTETKTAHGFLRATRESDHRENEKATVFLWQNERMFPWEGQTSRNGCTQYRARMPEAFICRIVWRLSLLQDRSTVIRYIKLSRQRMCLERKSLPTPFLQCLVWETEECIFHSTPPKCQSGNFSDSSYFFCLCLDLHSAITL